MPWQGASPGPTMSRFHWRGSGSWWPIADLFLDLVWDTDLGVAFTRQADTGELEAPILLRRSPLTFLDSVLLLYLRGLLTQADARGDSAVVSEVDMVEQLKLYERSQNADRAGFEKRTRAAIEKAKKNNIISAIRSSKGRYIVSQSLKLMFSAEEITALTRTYRACATDAANAEEADR
jgi:hypothetical protein